MSALQAAAPEPAHVLRLRLQDFRNWSDLDLIVEPKPVVLCGPNGTGKTAILEAVSYLAPGRGLASAKLGEIVRQRSNRTGGWAVSADIGGFGAPVRIGTGLQLDAAGRERRVFRFDSEPASPSDIAEYVRLVWLTPAMDRLFVDSAGTRRRFLDRLCASVHTGHATRVSRYEQAMSERNRLLKDGQTDVAWFEGLERTMAEEGVAIAAVRNQTVSALNTEISSAGLWDEPSLFPQAELSLEGAFEEQLMTHPAVRVEQALAKSLTDSRPRDALAGRTLVGPHRTDMKVKHLARDCPAELASGGEQKALLVGMTLAHVRLVASHWGRLPILLLDEVCAFLDKDRREALLSAVARLGCQVWITGSDADLFHSLSGTAVVVDTQNPSHLVPSRLL